MYKFVLKRIVMLIPVIIGVTFVVFFILSVAPGDPVLTILGDGATDEAIAPSLKNRAIVSELYEKGIFSLKDSVVRIAQLLGISRNTVYLHLRNLSTQRQEQLPDKARPTA